MRWNFASAGLAIGLLTFMTLPTGAAVVTVGVSNPPENLDQSTCMDVQGNNPTPGTVVIAYMCHAGPNQQFQFQGTTIYAMGATRCLEADLISPGPTPLADHIEITSQVCSGAGNQQFSYENGQIQTTVTAPEQGPPPFCLSGTLGSQLGAQPCIVNTANEQWQIK
jgi:hypothetical protein